MKVIFHEDFYQVYSADPAAAAGRMEAIVEVIQSHVEFVPAVPATTESIELVHTKNHIKAVRDQSLYSISALAAGAAIQTAELGLEAPSFGLLRPPGHHASADSSWGFCFFNNMAIALECLICQNTIRTAYVLDIDLHYGDGNINILAQKSNVTLYNVEASSRHAYLAEIDREMGTCSADIIGISAGFDNHTQDWGGLLHTDDYRDIGRMVRNAAERCGAGCFGILEGGYNHDVLGHNVKALLEGLSYGFRQAL
jgi:acetoin utilization deacetylase AcuC-like enzyme